MLQIIFDLIHSKIYTRNLEITFKQNAIPLLSYDQSFLFESFFENGDVVGSSYVKLFFCKKLLDKGLGRSLIETCSLTRFQQIRVSPFQFLFLILSLS